MSDPSFFFLSSSTPFTLSLSLLLLVYIDFTVITLIVTPNPSLLYTRYKDTHIIRLIYIPHPTPFLYSTIDLDAFTLPFHTR